MWQAAIADFRVQLYAKKVEVSVAANVSSSIRSYAKTARKLQLCRRQALDVPAPSHGDASRDEEVAAAEETLADGVITTAALAALDAIPQDHSARRVTISWHLSIGFVESSPARGSGQEEGQGHGAGGQKKVLAHYSTWMLRRGRTAVEAVFTSAESLATNSTSTQGIRNDNSTETRVRKSPLSLV